MPEGYFTFEKAAALRSLQKRALSDPHEDILADFPPDLMDTVSNSWRPYAVQFYRNWLLYLAERKANPESVRSAFA